MTYLDFSVIIVYLLFISWRGFSSRNDHETTDDFFLAGRTLKWPVIGLSLYATNISISSIIGLSSSGYNAGVAVFNYEWTGAVMLIIFAVFIVPYYLRYRVATMPEFLGRRFDDRSRFYFSILSITISVLIDIAGAIYVGSIVMKGIFPAVELYVFIILIALFTGLYTVAGGLKAVVVTDSIQAILLTIGCGIVAVASFMNAGSIEELQRSLDPSFLSLIQPTNDPYIPWPSLLISLPILGFYFMCSNQHMVQRVLGAQTLDDGRKGAIFAALLKLPLLFILVLPGVFGIVIFPGLENPNLIFPELMFEFIPVGVLGIILTGFIAAMMSSIDSALTASSSIATLDIYKKFRPESDQQHLIKMGKIFILAAVCLASLWAPFIERFPTLWEYLQSVLSYLSPPVVACYIFGLFWKKATAKAAYYTLLSGSGFAALLVINNHFYTFFFKVHFLYSATILFIFSCLIIVVVSLGSPEETVSDFFAESKKSVGKPEASSWYNHYLMFAAMVLTTTIILVAAFW